MKRLASECVIKKDVMTIPLCVYFCQAIYVTSLNKRSNLRNILNHYSEMV